MHLLLASAALLMAGPTAAPAEDGAASQLATITVTGRSRGYIALDSVTATRTDTLLINVPQTITVVTRAQLDDQALQGLGVLVDHVDVVTILDQAAGNLRPDPTTTDHHDEHRNPRLVNGQTLAAALAPPQPEATATGHHQRDAQHPGHRAGHGRSRPRDLDDAQHEDRTREHDRRDFT